MKSILITILLVLSMQASAQNMFFHPFTFMEVPMNMHNQTWAVFEDDGRYTATGMCPQGFFVARTEYNGDFLSFNTYDDGLSLLYLWNHGSWYSGEYGNKIITVQDSIFLFDSEWNKTSLSPIAGVPHPRNVAVLADGNYVFVNCINESTYTLVKVNSQTKEVIWTSDQLIQNFNPRLYTCFYFRELIVLPDGGILAVARDYHADSYGIDWYGSTLFKIDPAGNLISTFIIPDVYYYHTYYEDGLFTSLIAEDFSYYQDPLYYVTTMTADGQEIIKFAIPPNRYACYILKDGDKILVLEYERSKVEMVLEAYTENGSFLWSSKFTLTSQYQNIDHGMVIATHDGGYLIYGDIYPSGNSNSLPFFLKTNQNGQSAPLVVQANEIPNPYHLYPNPSNNHIRITGNGLTATGNVTDISIFDIRGNLHLSAPNSSLPLDLNITNLPKGLYILKLTNEEKAEVMKFIKQ